MQLRRRPRAALPGLALAILLGPLRGFAEAPAEPRYALIADAGSTGTRVYLFRLDAPGGKVDISDVGKGPALTSFQATPERAAEAVLPQLEKARDLIPEPQRGAVPVSVFATAGMRLVPQEVQDAIYDGLRKGLLSFSGGFPFDSSRLQARTISGREEGVFALVAANYLAKHVDTSLRAVTGSLMGVLDLGGSSTQVAAPPVIRVGDSVVPKLGSEHTFVRSFLNLGMERMRQRTFGRFVERASDIARSRRAVPNPCSFYGYTEEGEVWRGTGDAAECEAEVAAALKDERSACAALQATVADCLYADPVPVPTGPSGEAKFFLISGYLYVTDFARWVVQQVRDDGTLAALKGLTTLDKPTIAELRQAAATVCAESWSNLSAAALDPERKHRFTGAKKVSHRCFEINYIVALLSVGYGFNEEERLFHIVDDIDGGEIEWTLGAFLHTLALDADPGRQAREL